MAPSFSHRGQKRHDNVVSAFFNSFMSAGEQKFTVVSSFFSSGLFLVALALVKQLSSLQEQEEKVAASLERQDPSKEGGSLAAPLPRPDGRCQTPQPPPPSPPPSASPSSFSATSTARTRSPNADALTRSGRDAAGHGERGSGGMRRPGGPPRPQEGQRVALDDEFGRQLLSLLHKLIPSWKTREAACLGGMVFLLLARSACDLRMINLVVGAEKAIVLGNRPAFRISLARFLRFMVPVACVNALLKYTTRELSLGLRQRLTEHLQSKYMKGFTFYSMAVMEGHAR
ncbi:atp-binding cassette sub-family d member 3 [Nannochloropsis gaditana]|uniref:Atp-binding cassette sub-family d member 3 n=1 Tax=Nannochloropsis gaditana TaxID=72520 RepID=W7T9S0_9STRA|nr:atp-binding cassette sub-family d member 3 [Nannochloropsis gaditana]